MTRFVNMKSKDFGTALENHVQELPSLQKVHAIRSNQKNSVFSHRSVLSDPVGYSKRAWQNFADMVGHDVVLDINGDVEVIQSQLQLPDATEID